MSRRILATFAAAALLVSCSDGGQPAAIQPAGKVARFEIVSGNDQAAAPGDELPQPLAARAVDANGNPVPGRQIAFRVTEGGGSMYVGGGVTNASGVVKDYWTLGTVAGALQRVEARTVDPETGERQVVATFNAQAVLDNAVPGRVVPYPDTYPNQKGLVGRVQPVAFRVIATDRFGNALHRAGITVHWTASGNGRVNFSETVTDSTGVTGARWWFATTPGPQTLTASLGGTTQPAVFNGTATPGPVTSLVVVPAQPHFSSVGDTIRMSATATDSYGNPWPITWNTPGCCGPIEFTGTPPRLKALANGAVFFVVSAGSQADTVYADVVQVPVTAAFRTSFPATLPLGGALQLKSYVVARDANGNIFPSAPFTFEMSEPTMGTIDGNFVFRPSRKGSVQFTATTSNGISVTSPVLQIQ